jgi:hypothetical protein
MTNNTDKQSFGEAGCQIISGTTQSPPAGEYCAVTFVVDSTIATGFSAAEAPLWGGTKTGITYPAGFTVFTPFVITASPTGTITGTAIFYKAI